MWDENRSYRNALLVLDVQNYFFDAASPAYLESGPKVLTQINKLVSHAVKSEWTLIVTAHQAPFKPGNLMSEKWRHLPQGKECDLFPGLVASNRARRISKEHYSAFFKTDLEEILHRETIDRVVICGVMTHLCVDTTTRHAFMLGFRPIVASDACCSKTDAYHTAALLVLAHGFARICTTEEITTGGMCSNV